MRIHNVRLGLATNSSSTHSLILLPPGVELTTDEYGDFGWQHFTAADEKSKENYLGYLVWDNLRNRVSEHDVRRILQELFPHRHHFPSALENAGYGVDHQSAFPIPTTWDGQDINREFFAELYQLIVKSPVAILGGHDNGDIGHPFGAAGRPVTLTLPRDEARLRLVAKKDGTVWTLFNRETGAKMRCSFTPTGLTPEATADHDDNVGPSRASTPELVDLKITNACPFGCTYCYQASVPTGAHAPFERIVEIADALADLQVFEVAIGGGEPTLHPEFIPMLAYFHALGIVPNFTTRNLAWLKQPELRASILEHAGAFAYSVETAADVERLLDALGPNQHLYDGPERGLYSRATVQYVVGCGGDLRGILRAAADDYLRVVLLGFKQTGFGAAFDVVEEDWIAAVNDIRAEQRHVSLGVDTAIIQRDEAAIRERLKVHPVLMTREEGKFSMYIDAVTNRMGPSSYCNETAYHSLPADPAALRDGITAAFASW